MASNISAYNPIVDGSEATPGLWNSRFSQMQANIQVVDDNAIDPLASVVSFAGRIYVNGKIDNAGVLSTDSLIQFTRGAGISSNISAPHGLTVKAHGGTLKLDASGKVELAFADAQSMTVGTNGVLVNSGVTLKPEGPLQLTGPFSITIPASAGAAGVQGEVRFSPNTMYVCVAANSWKTVAMKSWS